jgi:hypothetical protein
MPSVEDYWVLRGVENPVYCNCGFNNTEIRAKMPASFCNRLHQMFSDLAAEFNQLFGIQRV